jgi:hypothetical protein
VVALTQLLKWHEENQQQDEPGRPLTASLKDFVDVLLQKELNKMNHGSLKSPPIRAMSVSVPAFHRKIKTVLKQINQIEHEDWQELVDALALQEGNMPALDDLRELHRQLDDLVRIVNRRQTE